jgi:hypothetical protein
MIGLLRRLAANGVVLPRFFTGEHPFAIFLDTVAKDFAKNGAEAIARVRLEEPVMYLKLVRSLVPRELIAMREQAPDVDYSELTDVQIVELIEAEKRRGIVQRVLQITAGR